jgi:hypothetical protein
MWELSLSSGLQGGECCLCWTRELAEGCVIDEKRGRTYVFQAIEILVSFATDFAFVRFLLFHAERSRVGSGGFGVDD